MRGVDLSEGAPPFAAMQDSQQQVEVVLPLGNLQRHTRLVVAADFMEYTNTTNRDTGCDRKVM